MLIGSIVGEKAAIGQEKYFGILKKQQKCVKENAGLQFFTAKLRDMIQWQDKDKKGRSIIMSDTKKSAKGPALRKEHDSMGEILVPCDKYWGAQTQRSFENFRIGTEKMPPEVISAFAILKKSAAQANCELGTLPKEKAVLIEKACEEILDAVSTATFPLRSGKPEAAPRAT